MIPTIPLSQLQNLAGTMTAPEHLKKKVTASDIMEAVKQLEATRKSGKDII